jgi:hypothetical protein
MLDQQTTETRDCTDADKSGITALLTAALAHADMITGLEMIGIHICTALDALASHSTVERCATAALFQE